jgi:hypothetical protein
MSVRTVAIGVLAWLAVAALPAQEREDRTLRSHDQMRAIVSEASGERALHTVLEIRDFLSGEFEPVPVEDVLAVLEARQAAGTIKLAAQTPPAPRR